MCCNLTYAICNETPKERLFSKADKLRKSIGAKPGAFNPLPYFKPKYMRYTTWMKIRYRINCLEGVGLEEIAIKLGSFS